MKKIKTNFKKAKVQAFTLVETRVSKFVIFLT